MVNIPLSNRRMSANEFISSQKICFVYGWWRDGNYLYIGQTTKGMTRFATHHVIGVVDTVLPSDTFDFWDMPEHEIKNFETKLILHYKPKYNKFKSGKRNYKPINAMVFAKIFTCATCQTNFQRVLRNQFKSFCSIKCFNLYARKNKQPVDNNGHVPKLPKYISFIS